MPLGAGASATQRYVCFECIDDRVLKAEIQSLGRRRLCSYCKTGGRAFAVSIEALAERIEPIYLEFVEMGEDELVADADSDNAHWETRGSAPNELIAEMIECDDAQIADDVVSLLSDANAYDVVKDGATDWFDATSEIYQLRVPTDFSVRDTWDGFCETIKHDSRFLNEHAVQLLGELLDPVLNGQWPRTGSAIKTITPSDEDRYVFRGRLANDPEARKAIYRSPVRQLSAPPRHLSTAGRMNAAGITNFYGSFDKDTCVAELRASVGGQVVVGKFEIIRSLRLFDLTALETASTNLSYFEPGFVQMHSYDRFLRSFHDEIKKPVLPGRETLEYLPTQFVCEYLWRRVTPMLDGMIYGSSQLSTDAHNIVLFPHSSNVEGYESEATAEISVSMAYDEDSDQEVVWVKQSAAGQQPSTGGGASLRYLNDELSVSTVRAISYETESRKVWFFPERTHDAAELDRPDGPDAEF